MEVLKRYFFILGGIIVFFIFYLQIMAPSPQKEDVHFLEKRKKNKVAVTIPAKQFYEKCFQLTTRQLLDYQFEIPEDIQFNIHFHTSEKMYYAHRPERISQVEETFVPDEDRTYCLTWQSYTKAPLRLVFQFEVRDRLPQPKDIEG